MNSMNGDGKAMRMSCFIGIAIAIALGFTACERGLDNTGGNEGALVTDTFCAGFSPEEGTKTAYTPGKHPDVIWSANDKIYYYSADGGTVRNYQITTSCASATIELSREVGDNYYSLVYNGGEEPTFTSRTKTNMVFDGVKQLQNGKFANANVSVAAAVPGATDVIFKPVTAMVKFTISCANVRKVVLTGGLGTETVAGNISVDPTSDTPSATVSGTGFTTVTADLGENIGGTFYINILPGTYTNGLKLAFYNAADDLIGYVTPSQSITLSAGKMLSLDDKDSNFVDKYILPDGVLMGVFSVSDSKKVRFSKGNLWSDTTASPQTWSFEENQYDYWLDEYVEENHVTLFFCDKDYGFGMTGGASGDFSVDWGAPYCEANGLVPGTWRTPAKDEWEYLLFDRSASTVGTTADARYAKVKVDGGNGLLIFPDEFSWTESMGTPPSDCNSIDTMWSDVPSYTMEEFSAIESGGCVFLPAAGWRSNNRTSSHGRYCYYWSSTPNGADYTFQLHVFGSKVELYTIAERTVAVSVRLVTDVNS